MNFIVCGEHGYRQAVLIKRGAAHRDPAYHEFFERFQARYGIRPLTINLDHLDPGPGSFSIPRLSVFLERSADYRSFYRRRFDPDPAKERAIARMLTESVPAPVLQAGFNLPGSSRHQAPRPERMAVSCADFEDVSKQEVHELTAADSWDDFAAGLGIPDQFWRLWRYSGPPTVFVHTEEQARSIRASELPARWADSYFELASRHDEFGYLDRAEITVPVDSKENFERNYESNWLYYSR